MEDEKTVRGLIAVISPTPNERFPRNSVECELQRYFPFDEVATHSSKKKARWE